MMHIRFYRSILLQFLFKLLDMEVDEGILTCDILTCDLSLAIHDLTMCLLWINCVFVSCVSHALASVHCCFVVTCWERADLLAIVGDDYCIFVT